MNEKQEGLLLLQNKVEYLKDTIGILVNYDNENTIEGLKALIDETRTRLEKIINGDVTDEDLGMTEEQFNERASTKDWKSYKKDMSNNVISFLNANTNTISHFEEMEHGLLVHMKNGDTVEFYSDSNVLAFHYKDDEEED